MSVSNNEARHYRMQRHELGSKLQGWPSQGPRLAFSPSSPVIPRPSFPSYPRYGASARTEEIKRGRKGKGVEKRKEEGKERARAGKRGIAIGSVPIPPGRYADLKFNAMKRFASSLLFATSPLSLSLYPFSSARFRPLSSNSLN